MRTGSKRALSDTWWYSMSRNGIRSLVIVLIVMMALWSAVVINIMHFAGVFNG